MEKEKDYGKLILYGFLAFVFLILAISIFSVSKLLFSSPNTNPTGSMSRVSTMGLTSYDKELAIKFMDKNHDGRCDVCGMDVQLCMDSGQIQCNMDSKSTIGVLGSQHIHADFKVYVNGNPINFADSKYYMKSSFIHVDNNQNKEDASGVLHMHATGVPLWIFFESIGMKFDKDCITLDNGEKFCNTGENTLKFYVNGKSNSEWKNYVFKDLDKILISYGSENDLSQQLNSVTDFAKKR